MIFFRVTYVLFCLLQEKSNNRKQDLEDSVQTQQYLSEASEAESWLLEKEPIACGLDYGKDEDTAQVCISVINVINSFCENRPTL